MDDGRWTRNMTDGSGRLVLYNDIRLIYAPVETLSARGLLDGRSHARSRSRTVLCTGTHKDLIVHNSCLCEYQSCRRSCQARCMSRAAMADYQWDKYLCEG